MKIISTCKEDDIVLAKIKSQLENQNIFVLYYEYADGFGGTVWSVDDLDEFPKTREWSNEKRIAFFEYAQKNLCDNAVSEGWEAIRVLIDLFESDCGSEDDEDEQ